MLYQATASTALTPNITGGSSVNAIQGTVAGNVICGGGSSHNDLTPGHLNDPNFIAGGNFDVIGGGANQDIDTSNFAFIGGGFDNGIRAHCDLSTIAGGWDAEINPYSPYSFIGGGVGTGVQDSSAYSSMVGGDHNLIGHGTHHVFIGGGYTNVVDTASHYSGITGGYGNYISPWNPKSFIGGGYSNFVKSTLSSIVGGDTNLIDGLADHSFIGGGQQNQILSNTIGSWNPSHHSVIGGGYNNVINNDDHADISDTIQRAGYVTIGGGINNHALERATVIAGGDSNFALEEWNSIGGGRFNQTTHPYATIAGGDSNQANGHYAFVGGGLFNNASGLNSTIAGGHNCAAGGQYSFIGGGGGDTPTGSGSDFNEAEGMYSVVAGGRANQILIADYSFIGGGQGNTIPTLDTGTMRYNAIVGGEKNTISPTNLNADHSFIGGGYKNAIHGTNSVICGGDSNIIDQTTWPNTFYSFIGGGYHNFIAEGGSLNVLTGGQFNFNCGWLSAMVGGDSNTIFSRCAFDFLGGGYKNYIGNNRGDGTEFVEYSTIGGGDSNIVNTFWSTIGGGQHNLINEASFGDGTAQYATIPGGRGLTAQSYGQTVIGVFNLPRGSATESTFLSTINFKDQPIFMIGNGTPTSAHNGFEVSNGGHATVYDQNGPGNVRAAFLGTTYEDNVINAWAEVDGTATPPNIISNFGVSTVTRVRPGCYLVTLNIKNPLFSPATSATLANAAITATLVDVSDTSVSASGNCGIIMVSQIGNPGTNQFVVRTIGSGVNCATDDKRFMFHVVGR